MVRVLAWLDIVSRPRETRGGDAPLLLASTTQADRAPAGVPRSREGSSARLLKRGAPRARESVGAGLGDLLWHLHDLWPEQVLPGSALLSNKWTARIARRLARAEQTARVRIARGELRQMREFSRTLRRA